MAFGRPLSDQGVIREWIADSRMEIEQARLLTLKAAYLMDTVGNKGAATRSRRSRWSSRTWRCKVIDRAIQAHGGGGVSDDFPAGAMYAGIRTLRLADGPDEVHRRQVAKRELGRYTPDRDPARRRPRLTGPGSPVDRVPADPMTAAGSVVGGR